VAIVFRSDNAAEAHRIRGLLEAHGIAAEVSNELLAGARGELPLDLSTIPTVWIAEDARAEEARRIIEDHAQAVTGPPWRCRSCGELLDAAFTSCWNCGAERRGGGPPWFGADDGAEAGSVPTD